MKNAAQNAFHWRGKSQTVDKFGRMKTERQILLDANRVNPTSDVCKSAQTKSEKAPR